MFNIVPQPVTILTNNDKKGFTLHSGTTISPFSFSEEFVRFIRKHFNKKILVHEDTFEEKSIILTLDNTIEWDEGYTLKCENRRVYINAKTETGLFYGLETLKQMLLQTEGKLPYTEITDYPKFSYRGYKIIMGEKKLSVEEMKKIIELMAFHKLNTLNCDLKSYYTQSESDDLVAYCQAKKINVVTETPENIENSAKPYCLNYPHGVNTLKSVCDNKPDESKKGIETGVNVDFVKDFEQLQYLTLPRIAAMAETAWATDYGSFATFVHKAPTYYKLLDFYEVKYAPLKKACPSALRKCASKIIFKTKGILNKNVNF